ncbi:MAG: type II secretion system protein [Terrimicrobiaceae bacterium]
MKNRKSGSAFTIIEIVSVVAILAILVAVLLPTIGSMIGRAESAQCLANMRSIHVSLLAYIQDKGSWPQDPEAADHFTQIDETWWINEMLPYGVNPETWMCPTIRKATSKSPDAPKIHYTPGKFGSNPRDPFKFSTQPWLLEIAGMHARGANICFPDGSIRSMDDLVPPSP